MSGFEHGFSHFYCVNFEQKKDLYKWQLFCSTLYNAEGTSSQVGSYEYKYEFIKTFFLNNVIPVFKRLF